VSLPDRCEPAKNLFIAVPCRDGKPSMETATAMMDGGLQVLASGRALQSKIVAFDPYIDRCRNELVTDFLDSDATDLLFLDDDVGVQRDGILKIAAVTRPFVGGVYPMKRWHSALPEFPINVPQEEYRLADDGLCELNDVLPTGFLRLNRAIFEHMPYQVYEVKGKRQLGFFKTRITSDVHVGLANAGQAAVGRYVGEDVGFCQEWLKRGGKIWLMPNLHFVHVGWGRWEANLHQHLSR
jgi:hypothetical protein